MPVMSRGPEIEIATLRDVEDLKHMLAQHMIHVPNDVLKRAIVLPKDIDTTGGRYAKPSDLLPKNPAKDVNILQRKDEQRKLMKDVSNWRQETFPWADRLERAPMFVGEDHEWIKPETEVKDTGKTKDKKKKVAAKK